MFMIYVQVIGCGIFAVSSIVLALLLRKSPTEKVRKSTTEILHAITVITFFLPVLIGIFYPCLTAYDSIIGIPSMAHGPLLVICGVLLIPIGFLLKLYPLIFCI